MTIGNNVKLLGVRWDSSTLISDVVKLIGMNAIFLFLWSLLTVSIKILVAHLDSLSEILNLIE